MKANFRYLITVMVMHLSFSHTNAQPIGTAVIHDKLRVTDSTFVYKRMRLNGITATCDSPKVACPGYFGDIGVHYKTYYYTNESAFPECINVMLDASCASQLFCAAYLGTFDRNDVCNQYLADPGLSIANGGTDSMSFTVPAGVQYCIVVNGIMAVDTCDNYTLRISQQATSWHGSIANTDSTQTQRLHLDGVRYTCQNVKQLCAKPPKSGLVYHDGYLYNNTTPNAICIRATLYHHCMDTASKLTFAAYLNSYDSMDVCYNLAADAGITTVSNDSSWFSFLAPAASDFMLVVYSQKDTLFCNDYVLKVDADFTTYVQQTSMDAAALQVFPNPVVQGEQLILKYSDANYTLVEVYDVTARKVFSKQITDEHHQFTMPTSLLTKGVYFVKASGENKSVAKKIVVQ